VPANPPNPPDPPNPNPRRVYVRSIRPDLAR
jgi:hypothetical protein